MKRGIIVSVMVAAVGVCKAEEKELAAFRDRGPFKSITAAQGNLAIMFRKDVGNGISYPDDTKFLRPVKTLDYAENDKALILTPSQRVEVGGFKNCYVFTPVMFKSQQRGFRITYVSHGNGLDITRTHTYIALGDIPAEMGEDGVEMIMESGEWVAYEKTLPVPPEQGGTQTVQTPPKPDEPPPPPESEPPPDGAEDAQPEAQAKTRTLWPYALIPPAFLAALYFMRRKRR